MLHGCQLCGNEISLSVQFPMFSAELLVSLQLKAQVVAQKTCDLSDVGSVTNKLIVLFVFDVMLDLSFILCVVDHDNIYRHLDKGAPPNLI